jgi:putative serine protease PepD
MTEPSSAPPQDFSWDTPYVSEHHADVPYAPEPAPAGPARRTTIVWLLVAALLVGALGGAGTALALNSRGTGAAIQLPISPAGTEVARPDGSVASVAAQVMPSVVSIEATNSGVRTSTGSGFVIREDGYILTNGHVIESSDGTVEVLISDGRVVEGEVVGSTTDYDLAVVKIEETGLTPLVLGDSDAIVVGDPVIAIGSPLGLDATVTTGIVSSLHRPVTAGGGAGAPAFIDAIQTDAAINPGNSGGPLLNARGEVIGVNSAVAALPGATAQSGAGSVGLGFAIPSNQARRTAEELIETGTATFPVIGVNLDQAHTGQGVGILENDDVEGIIGVVPGSPADVAGIRPGDVILAIDGRAVARADELVVAIRAMAPGDVVSLTIDQGGKSRDIDVTLTSNVDVNFGDGEIEPEGEE